MNYDINPFPVTDSDRHAIWEMLVYRDIEAFLSRDWSMVSDDFISDEFFGTHAHFLSNPDGWRLSFPDLDSYRDEWLRQAEETANTEFAEDLRDALFRATVLRDIEINGARAIIHKKFDGSIKRPEGQAEPLQWQTLYFSAKREGRWKLTGFVGYLPNPMGV